MNKHAMLVHISFPKGYNLISPATVDSSEGVASIYLTQGMNTLVFSKGSTHYSSTLHINANGGEAYISVSPENMCTIIDVSESK